MVEGVKTRCLYLILLTLYLVAPHAAHADIYSITYTYDIVGNRKEFTHNGTIDTVLLERDNGRLQGRSRRYFTVHVLAQNLTHNDLVTVKLIDNTKDAATATPV